MPRMDKVQLTWAQSVYFATIKPGCEKVYISELVRAGTLKAAYIYR